MLDLGKFPGRFSHISRSHSADLSISARMDLSFSPNSLVVITFMPI